MKTRNLFKRIRTIIVGNTQPKNEDLWLDTSNGESKAVLKYKGRSIAGGGDKSDTGYEVTKHYVTIDEETVTTSEYNGQQRAILSEIECDIVPNNTYEVTFNGIKYECIAYTRDSIELGAVYNEYEREYDFSKYPFNINYGYEDGWVLITSEAGTYSIKVEEVTEEVSTTPEFKSAVDSVTGYSIDTKETTPEFESMIQELLGFEILNIQKLPCYKPMSEIVGFHSNTSVTYPSDFLLADGWRRNGSIGAIYYRTNNQSPSITVNHVDGCFEFRNCIPPEIPQEYASKITGEDNNLEIPNTLFITYEGYIADFVSNDIFIKNIIVGDKYNMLQFGFGSLISSGGEWLENAYLVRARIYDENDNYRDCVTICMSQAG